jgi:hypothetical protein
MVVFVRNDGRRHAADGFNQNCRELWGAVVLQAREDVRLQPLHSIEYDQAVAFFIGGGEWAGMRTVIGDFIGVHADNLEAVGRQFINERLALTGLPPLPPRSSAKSRPTAAAAPVQPDLVVAQPVRASITATPGSARAQVPARSRTRSPAFNPFFPRGLERMALADRTPPPAA